MYWAPYWYKDGKHIIYTAADHSDPTVRPNYDLYWMNIETGKKMRITYAPGQDVLPVFSPDYKKVMWTTSRDGRHRRSCGSPISRRPAIRLQPTPVSSRDAKSSERSALAAGVKMRLPSPIALRCAKPSRRGVRRERYGFSVGASPTRQV